MLRTSGRVCSRFAHFFRFFRKRTNTTNPVTSSPAMMIAAVIIVFAVSLDSKVVTVPMANPESPTPIIISLVSMPEPLKVKVCSPGEHMMTKSPRLSVTTEDPFSIATVIPASPVPSTSITFPLTGTESMLVSAITPAVIKASSAVDNNTNTIVGLVPRPYSPFFITLTPHIVASSIMNWRSAHIISGVYIDCPLMILVSCQRVRRAMNPERDRYPFPDLSHQLVQMSKANMTGNVVEPEHPAHFLPSKNPAPVRPVSILGHHQVPGRYPALTLHYSKWLMNIALAVAWSS